MWDIVKVSNACKNKQTNKNHGLEEEEKKNGTEQKFKKRWEGVFLWLMEDTHQERRSRTKATIITLIKTIETDTEGT